MGAYRPDEVALGRDGERHPLEPVANEFKRYYGDVWVDLGQAEEAEGRQFVDAVLDTKPNQLGEDFREALYHHTVEMGRGFPWPEPLANALVNLGFDYLLVSDRCPALAPHTPRTCSVIT